MRQTIGPYRIVHELGRGGQGVVYRVEHHETGAPAALKTVRTPSPERMQGLRREIHALARLQHPGVVRILDEGQQAGLPWYAMELVEGRTLLEHCRGLWQPEPGAALPAGALHGVLSTVRRLCAPLAYLHGEGVVHRDLKPQNVLVRGDGTPVLVDFGLVARLGSGPGREALELADEEGTAAYMAPEQLRGEPLDARADLYGLGCLLYEALTGQPTYERIPDVLDPGRFPRRPSEWVFGIPPELDELVLRLLSKDPAGRIGHADVVAAALGRLGAEDGPIQGPRPRAYLYRPGFAGRQRLLGALLQHAETRLWTGAGGLILVGGESGIGKTRFVLELGRAAASSGIRVLAGECVPGAVVTEGRSALRPYGAMGSERQGDSSSREPRSPVVVSGVESARAARGRSRHSPRQGTPAGRTAPLAALRQPLQAVADLGRERGLEETERLLGRRGKVLAAYEPALRELPGQDAYPEPAELPPKEARLRIFGYLAETLGALCAEKPLLLVLDDLQWADELTMGFLEFLLCSGRLERTPLLLLGTYRTEESSEALRGLLGLPGTRGLELGRLDEEAVAEEVGDMLGLRPPPAIFARHLARHSEGNPFFVAEYLRAAVETGLLWRDQEGRWQVAEPVAQHAAPEATDALYESLPLPHSLRELVGRRLEGLGEAARRFADAAAVLGRQMEPRLLADVAGAAGAEAMEAVTELVRRQVLEQLETGDLRFLHDKLREAAYERIPPERRRGLHRSAATAIEAPAGAERPAALFAHHWEQAGVPDRASEFYLEAAREAASRHAYLDAERCYRAFLSLTVPPAAGRLRAGIELVRDVLNPQGKYHAAAQDCQQLLSEADSIQDTDASASLWLELAWVYRMEGKFDAARAACEQCLTLSRAAGNQPSEARALSMLGSILREQGHIDEAKLHFEEALAILEAPGKHFVTASFYTNFAILFYVQGQLSRAHELYEKALRVAQEAGDRSTEAMALGNLAVLYQDLGQIREAQAHHQRALDIAREIGAREKEGRVLGNLANLHLDEGRLDEAQLLYQQALAIKREVGPRHEEGHTLGNLALLHVQQGRPQEARACFEQASAIAREMQDLRFEGAWHLFRGELERQLGQIDQAERSLAQAQKLLGQVSDSFQLAGVSCERGHLALARNRSGQRWLRAARRIAQGLNLQPQSKISQAIAALQRAQDAFRQGWPLFRGQLAEDLPQGLRRWLAETGQLPRGA